MGPRLRGDDSRVRRILCFIHESLMSSPRRIDFHFHLIPQFYQEAAYAAGAGPAIGRYPDWSPELALELMDAERHRGRAHLAGAAGRAVRRSASRAAALARRCNDYARRARRALAAALRRASRRCRCGICARRSPRSSIALSELKHQGVCLFASYGEKFLGDPAFRSGHGGAQRARRGRVRASGAASVEPQARSALAGLHDGISCSTPRGRR